MGQDTRQIRAIEQNNELINDILKRNYYKEFQKENSSKNIELIINRLNTNSKCYGCFNNTETKLYPHIDFSENDYDKIFENLSIFLKFYNQNQWQCPIELNGIDWSNDKNCEKILILLQNLSTKYMNEYFPKKIIIDTDFYSIINNTDDLWYKWKKRQEVFKNNNIILYFNIYANGPYCDDNNYSMEYYDKLVNLFKNHTIQEDSFKIITYIRPNNIKSWIKNYQWWIDNLGDLAFTNIELREEKTENWTYELIGEYINFLNYQIEYFQNKYDNEDFLKLIYDKNKNNIFQNIALLENKYLINENKNNNCNFFKNLTIDLTTMNIVPCAKVNYEDFACGQYIIENNEITKIKAKNVPIIIYNTHLKQSCMPHCELCPHVELCAGHCLGESYNKCFDMLPPIKEFCDLSKAKINFLIYRYNSLNLIDKKIMEKLNCNKLYIDLILDINNILMESI